MLPNIIPSFSEIIFAELFKVQDGTDYETIQDAHLNALYKGQNHRRKLKIGNKTPNIIDVPNVEPEIIVLAVM